MQQDSTKTEILEAIRESSKQNEERYREVLEAMNVFAEHVDARFDHLEKRMDHMETRVENIETNMITKQGLDARLSDLRVISLR